MAENKYVEFGQVFGQTVPKRSWFADLKNFILRFRPELDQRLLGLNSTQAPAGMDSYQAKAWSSNYKYNLVEAGAGSGKTFLVVQRAKILLDRGVLPESIAFVTFTNESTNELKHRLDKIVGPEITNRLVVKTLHKFSSDVAKRLGFRSSYNIYNNTDPRDPYRLAWKNAINGALIGTDSLGVAKIIQAWLMERDLLREGLASLLSRC